VNKDEIVRSIRAERRRTLSLLTGLEPERFDTPTALPRWRIREVCAHLITTDRAAVTGRILPQIVGTPAKLEAWNDRQVGSWADRPVQELLVGLDRWGRRFAGMMSALPAALYRPRIRLQWGRAPLGIAVWVRVYDEWIHRQDIRRALGLPDEDVDLESVAEFLLTAIGSATLPELAGRTGTVAISLEDVALPEWTYNLGEGTAAPGATGSPQAGIRAAAPLFVMAAAGRDRFDELRTRGALTVEGDEALAGELLAKLRIV
jgi:uncharacterized protein (TIGR03083 family)